MKSARSFTVRCMQVRLAVNPVIPFFLLLSVFVCILVKLSFNIRYRQNPKMNYLNVYPAYPTYVGKYDANKYNALWFNKDAATLAPFPIPCPFPFMHKQSNPSHDFSICIRNNGECWLGVESININNDNWFSRIAEQFPLGCSVVIRVDDKVEFGNFVKVVDMIQGGAADAKQRWINFDKNIYHINQVDFKSAKDVRILIAPLRCPHRADQCGWPLYNFSPPWEDCHR